MADRNGNLLLAMVDPHVALLLGMTIFWEQASSGNAHISFQKS